VAAYLHAYDLSRFEFVKAPPPTTKAFWALVGSGGSLEGALVADLLDTLGRPGAVTIQLIKEKATGELAIWFMNNPGGSRIRHLLEECNYRYFPNPTAKDTCWKVGGNRRAVYVRGDLTPMEQLQAKDALG
jgi:hypothetical protein